MGWVYSKMMLAVSLGLLGLLAHTIRANDWPQRRGPNRDDVSADRGPFASNRIVSAASRTSRQPSNNKAGGQHGYAKAQRALHDQPDRVLECKPSACRHCQHPL